MSLAEKSPRARPSFVGNAALVLIVFGLIVAMAAVLRDACSLGCPR